MKKLLVACLVWIGCKSDSKPADKAPPPSPKPVVTGELQLPPLYKPLFTRGKAWTFVQSYELRENGKVKSGGDHGVYCTVDDVQQTATAAVSSVHCVGDGGDTSIPDQARGIFVATADGLWQTCEGLCKQSIGDVAGIVAGLDPKAKLLTASPTAATVTWKNSDGDEAITQVTAPHAGGWCITTTKSVGDGWILCLQADKGIVGGRGFDHAKRDRESWFGNSPAI